MEKEALINIIVNDLKEVQQLVETFKGKQSIDSAFLRLATTKITNIEEEFRLLSQWSNATHEAPFKRAGEITDASRESLKNEQDDQQRMAESTNRFASGEASGSPECSGKEVVAEMAYAQSIEASGVEERKDVFRQEASEKPNDNLTTKPKGEKKEAAILADVFKNESASVNEQMTRKKEESARHVKLIGKPVDDIRKALGVNDRFYFQRELFAGNAELFNQSLDQINQLSSFEEASRFLTTNFGWDMDDEAVSTFMNTVKRRFL
jgi:hypothetical protein